MKERVGFPIAEYEEISPMILGKIKVRLFPHLFPCLFPQLFPRC